MSTPERPDLAFLRRRPPRRRTPKTPPASSSATQPDRPSTGSAMLDLGGPSVAPSPGTASSGPHRATGSQSLDLDGPSTPAPAAAPRQPPARSRPSGPATPQAAPARAAAPSRPVAAPGTPTLGWLRRRPPVRRTSAELVRTGNTALDISGGGVRTDRPGGTPAATTATHRTQVVNLRGRTLLNETTPSVRIGGEQATSGSLQLALTWSTLPTDQRSVQAGLRRSTDVHLGALWEMNDGQSGAVQTLGDGATAAPGYGSTVLRLGGRSETEGQTLTVALRAVGDLKRLLLYAYAVSGQPEWDALAPLLALTLRGGISVQMRLDAAPPGAGTCALLSLHRVGGVLVVRREAQFLQGQQQQVAEAFGWDLPWASGRTLPPVRVR